MQKDQFSKLLGEVWNELDSEIIRNGFKKGGVYPLKKNVIPEDLFDPDALKRFVEAKSKKIQRDIPTLWCLCLKTLNKIVDKKKHTMGEQKERSIILKPSEIILPGTNKSCSKIQIIEDRLIENEERKTFENLLLSIKKKLTI